jgi:hypothetical protein
LGIIAVMGLSTGPLYSLESPSALAHQEKKQPRAEGQDKGKSGSLTGCVDQQDGRYVLTDDRNLQPIADLEADGFPTEGFAKHVGHKVTVKGSSKPGSSRPVFKVRSIETVSQTCAPGQ